MDSLVTRSTELAALALGAILAANGLGAVVFHWAHRPARGLALSSFGTAVLLYGYRLFVDTPSFRAAVGGPPALWDFTTAFCTYLLPVPVFIFAEHFLGPGWRSSIRYVWQVHAAYAAVAIGIDLATFSPFAAMGPSALLVTLWGIVGLANMVGGAFPPAPDLGLVRGALFLLLLLIINENLVGLALVPWAVRLEPIGVLLFVACLGYALVERAFGNERRLAALDHELRTARRIQRSLLPTEFPRLKGGTLGARYVPMAAVGGDFYDCLAIDEHRVGLLVADVAGHGIPAALIASMVKTATAAQSSVASRPAEVLAGINQRLCDQVDGHYVTAVYVYIDLEAGRLWHASAGHPPALLLSRGTDSVHALGAGTLFLGFDREARYPTTSMRLAAGDRLVLYTDGVIEAMSPDGEFFDPVRLTEMLQQHADLSTEEWADALLARLTRWRSRASLDLDDDLALLILDVRQVGQASA